MLPSALLTAAACARASTGQRRRMCFVALQLRAAGSPAPPGSTRNRTPASAWAAPPRGARAPPRPRAPAAQPRGCPWPLARPPRAARAWLRADAPRGRPGRGLRAGGGAPPPTVRVDALLDARGRSPTPAPSPSAGTGHVSNGALRCALSDRIRPLPQYERRRGFAERRPPPPRFAGRLAAAPRRALAAAATQQRRVRCYFGQPRTPRPPRRAWRIARMLRATERLRLGAAAAASCRMSPPARKPYC
jgi:hypothetical protein